MSKELQDGALIFTILGNGELFDEFPVLKVYCEPAVPAPCSLPLSLLIPRGPQLQSPRFLLRIQRGPRELWDAGPAGCPPVGTGQHRPVRGRPAESYLRGGRCRGGVGPLPHDRPQVSR